MPATIGSLGRARASSRRATAFSKSRRSDWALSQRDLPFCDPAKPLRHPREIDDVDRIEGRSLIELIVDRRESGARDRGRTFYADIDIGPLAGELDARVPNRKTRQAGSGTWRRITEAANLAASTGFRTACMR